MSKAIYDAEATVLLKAIGSAAVTSTAASDAVDFEWEAGNAFAVVISVTEATLDDETYVFSVRSLDSAGSNAVAQVTLPTITEAGTYYALVDAGTAVAFDEDAAQLDLNCTMAGTAPSITYSAWLNPIRGVGRP